MEYKFNGPDGIEKKWQDYWKEKKVYQVANNFDKPKCYVLDMFPYPSGAGLHVGHPLGYIASDIYSRYKRLKGFNVLHPMGFDSFGLPAEQYALETGQHPAETTKKNIATFKQQLDKIGFCYDWEREVQTSDPHYYKWTQWIFLQLYNSYFNKKENTAKPIEELLNVFKAEGNIQYSIDNIQSFTANDWNSFDEKKQQDILMNYRLAFNKYGEVNWCEALGTVLANDEVVNGVSERGGHPVVKKKMRQWYLRITAYADRLLQGLETVDFSDSMKEMQRNWIGKSEGAEIKFKVQSSKLKADELTVYTTRPDTIFGVDFMVVAPELDWIMDVVTEEQKNAVEEYIAYVKSRSDIERQAEKKITGCFTGAYAINPFDGKQIPIWISEYVLAGYGTGAIMAVPCGDERDFKFAKHFNIPITNIIGSHYTGEEANPTKDATLENSGFLNGLVMKDAIGVAINKLEELGIGKRKVNFKMRDAGFSRQRYWGEPFPIVWNGETPAIAKDTLPLELPHVDTYGPGPDGQGPLANITEWTSSPSLLHKMEKGDTENVAKNTATGSLTVPKYKVGTPLQYEFAKQMRKDFTEAENHLWQEVRANKLDVKFRRQHPIENYIADFVCLQNALIVEVDGGYHETEEQKKYDAERTATLNKIGFTVIRFTNEEVMKETVKVIDTIKNTLQKLESHSNKENIESNEFSHPSTQSGEGKGVRETSTMPGYAGSSWYFLRYMDPKNNETFCDKNVSDYWNQVDLYVGGTEHAVGHLLYSRMWTKVLYDLGYISFDEPFKKLLNQGMIQGSSRFVYRLSYDNPNLARTILFNLFSINELNTIKGCSVQELSKHFLFFKKTEAGVFEKQITFREIIYFCFTISQAELFEHLSIIIDTNDNYYSGNRYFPELYFSSGKTDQQVFEVNLTKQSEFRCFEQLHVDVKYVDGLELNISQFKTWRDEFALAEFVLEDNGKYICGVETEKMSKRYFNTVDPVDLCDKYGADTFRMYEMFLGPVEQSKPWDTKGIEGVHRFLRKLWRLFNDDIKGKIWINEKATDAELKILHRTIKKIEEDTERFSFNTAVSAFMICINELADIKCYKKEILENILILLTPYAPHIAEELWHQLGNEGSVLDATYPTYNPALLVESSKEYPVSINGKMRTTISLALDLDQKQVEEIVLQNEIVQKWLEGKTPKKVIYVKNKMVNVVI